ncbi:MAG: CTP synthase [Chlamydiales bacterium]|nr:CTP synthase [Chlamydiales bacterium]
MPKRKYIFITGGVVSSLGKGLTLASLALLLEKRGYKPAMLKLDPYLNVDPGTMNPFEHGEVYVTDDGAETDLDLGHYYRYSNSPLNKASTATSGQIYETVLKNERRGDYLGKTVQVIPHITDEIKKRIVQCGDSADADLVLVEIGGTIGDIESLPFLEAIRQFRYERPQECLNIHMTYVPYLKAAGEVKTKPTQHSVQSLRSIGILPDLILCRCEESLSLDIKQKISLFCNVPQESVFDEVDVNTSIYEVPLMLEKQGVGKKICELLNLNQPVIDLSEWEALVESIKKPKGTVTVGIVGKYLQHKDAYKSVFEALQHGAIAAGFKLKIKTIESDKISSLEELKDCDGFLVPGGFGERGWEGKLEAAHYCRTNKIPYFGICLGMQVLVVEFARNILGLNQANSTEMDSQTPDPIISLLSEQEHVEDMGGTMRLGAYPCVLQEESKAYHAYSAAKISERHRHRYEFNNKYKEIAENHGLLVSGILENGHLCEIVEVKEHPWMLGVQFHPEFKSRPTEPHPLFRDFVKAMIEGKK